MRRRVEHRVAKTEGLENAFSRELDVVSVDLAQREVEQNEIQIGVDDFLAGLADPGELDKLMYAQSEQGLKQLKELVERILRDEAKGLP